MRSLYRMRSGGVVLGLGGLLVAFYVLSLVGILSGPVEAQGLPPSGQLPPADSPSFPSSPGATAPASATYGLPGAQPSLGTREAPREAPPLNTREQLRNQGIDQLVDHLNTLRARKAELDRQEKETVAVLKEKLKQQKEKLQKLGIDMEDTPSQAADMLPAPQDRVPAGTGGPGKK